MSISVLELEKRVNNLETQLTAHRQLFFMLVPVLKSQNIDIYPALEKILQAYLESNTFSEKAFKELTTLIEHLKVSETMCS